MILSSLLTRELSESLKCAESRQKSDGGVKRERRAITVERNELAAVKRRSAKFTPGITLREAHDEDEINGDESEEIAHDHPVNHHDERTDRLEAPAEE